MSQLCDASASPRPSILARARALPFLLATTLITGVAGAQPEEPAFHPPPVSDPMLAPPPAAPRQVKSWDDALALLRAHSPDYITSYESVRRAEAQTRIALAAVLPT